jgi:exosortase
VVEACSGLRSVITLLTLSVVMGYFLLTRVSSKLLLVAASIPIAIFVNLIRVVAIVLLFHFFGLDLYEGTLHTVTGLLIFLIALATLFMLQRILERWEQK